MSIQTEIAKRNRHLLYPDSPGCFGLKILNSEDALNLLCVPWADWFSEQLNTRLKNCSTPLVRFPGLRVKWPSILQAHAGATCLPSALREAEPPATLAPFCCPGQAGLALSPTPLAVHGWLLTPGGD